MFSGTLVKSELMSFLVINGVVVVISMSLIIKGKSLRDNKSSSGISASSNETSTGTALIVCGLLLLIAQILKIAERFM